MVIAVDFVLPLLLAATPVPVGGMVPFRLPDPATVESFQTDFGPVETFDPIVRAQLLADQLPRLWRGSYQAFGSATAVPVELRLDALKPIGQVVDLRGVMTIGSVTTPVQGNLNAKSDQFELLPLINDLSSGLEPGGDFLGLQGLSLSGWNAPRLTNLGGRLVLAPMAESKPVSPGQGPGPIRGLW
ncbi:hypothetical protein KQ313_05510 [Synechococcus sp. CS-1325]|uniref:hypothetical protein n=1 Tax=unclassified Synechococcus TaxID=2626047 RepID=UPI000DB135B7|nr:MULTISPECIES: hypothetical protein [unclassified Synechococcus]PZV01915.1 MAG: hypothetical protein DCF24_03025 [Cyanobium sp.]MCT0199131.1 hypothetical protein [Synechococcus sp. CS-1325]MCT0214690.1 hypothetical protein [Synechococcus sp. CS-1326]MCT0231120.1 hypothetical protein [Synechococcus sp. CS-1324]MCT0234024.1 hypothetical protein [Synechococcus sp. CS-1327]